MLWAWVGLLWLWIRNSGRKKVSKLKIENPDYEQIGVDVLWNILLGGFLIGLIALLIFGFYWLIKFVL